MRVVVNLQVGNEVELINAHIHYHLNLGVAGYVICDLFSHDGTRERLQRYRTDPRFVIRHVTEHELIDEHGIHTQELSSWMLKTARQTLDADWVVRMDADEFLFPRNGDLHAYLAQQEQASTLSLVRRNAIFPASTYYFRYPLNRQELAEQLIVAKPTATHPDTFGQQQLPLLLTEVWTKIIVRAEIAQSFDPGAHYALDAQQQRLPLSEAPDIISVHFWFTSLHRFRRKVESIRRFEALIRKYREPTVGWQWSLWAKLQDEPGQENSIVAEYRRQFPDIQRLDALRQQGVVRRAGDYWK